MKTYFRELLSDLVVNIVEAFFGKGKRIKIEVAIVDNIPKSKEAEKFKHKSRKEKETNIKQNKLNRKSIGVDLPNVDI